MVEVLEKKITVAEFRAMEFPDDNFIYELINGIIMRKSSPKVSHQRVSRRIAEAFAEYLKQNPNQGEYFCAPCDVFFDTYNHCQPDLLFITAARSFIIDEKEDNVMGTPDLVVEIISPGSIKADRIDKKKLYEQFAVKEYWLVDPNNRTVEQYLFTDNTLQLNDIFENEGLLKSMVLNNTVFDVNTFFD